MSPTQAIATVRPWVRVACRPVAFIFCGVFLVAAHCGQKPPPNPQMLIQQQACVRNLELRDYEAAETRCQICLEYDGTDPECLNGLGLVWYARGVDDKAAEYFRKAIRENNDFAQARNNLGVVLFNAADFDAAAPMFAAAVKIDPRYLDGRYNLALVYLRIGQRVNAQRGDKDRAFSAYDLAEDQYRRIFELYPEHTDSYRDMGLIMTYRAQMRTIDNKKRQDLKDAEEYFMRCLQLQPTHETCHESLAHILLEQGRYEEALFHDLQCLAAQTKNPICAQELPKAYEGSQLKSESLHQYITQLSQNPGYAPGHYAFCVVLFEKGLSEMAVTECETALHLDDRICLAHFQLGNYFMDVLNRDRATSSCRSFIGCADPKQNGAELQKCKDVIHALEVD